MRAPETQLFKAERWEWWGSHVEERTGASSSSSPSPTSIPVGANLDREEAARLLGPHSRFRVSRDRGGPDP